MMTGLNQGVAVTQMQKEQFKAAVRNLVEDLVEPVQDECKFQVKKVT
jgi:hypothetical protein